ncbi:hypothetical protein EJ419_00675 [Alloscardovia theropitheci]|uniref:Uncharacterized protein n=1 Tax=Alloscardovia theropitheci TaxID=2496842 RepID=A0A4R0QRF0_9BIFI|nr:hypothetical protein [Alloscardovia theropitheci]TCD54942.1 hypothetical protein EJ419_00675 [Alloscardovia theropitheci]
MILRASLYFLSRIYNRLSAPFNKAHVSINCSIPKNPLSYIRAALSPISFILVIITIASFFTSPSIAYASQSKAKSISITCDEAYVNAQSLSSFSQIFPSSISPISSVSSNLSARSWMDVASVCPNRISEGIIMSALAAVHSSWIDYGTNATSFDIDGSYPVTQQDAYALLESSFSNTDSSTKYLASDSLQSISVAEDRSRFAYEVLATRDYSTADLQDRATLGKLASQLFASQARLLTPTNYIDTRQRVYDTKQLIDYSGVNYSTHISMPLSASIELDTALEELQSLDNARTNLNTTKSASSDSNLQLRAVASWIRVHFIYALREGAPRVSTVYLRY